jgi:hypothetical protein
MAYFSINGTSSSKPYAPSTGVPTDMRSYYYDSVLFAYRPFQSTAEVLAYLVSSNARKGSFPIYINATGTLSGANFTGGIIEEYWFRTGTADSDLVLKASGGSGGASAAGISQQVQVNNGGAFSTDTKFTFNFTTKTLNTDLLSITKGDTTNTSVNAIKLATVQGTTVSGSQPYAHFYHTIEQATVAGDGQRNAVYHIGYNQNGAYGRVNSNEGSILMGFETHNPNFEFLVNSITKTGGVNKNLSITANKTTGAAAGSWRVDSMEWFPTGSGTSFMAVSNTANLVLTGTTAKLDMLNNGAFLRLGTQGDGSGACEFTNYGTGWDARFKFNSPGFNFASTYPLGNCDFNFTTTSTFAYIWAVSKLGFTADRKFFTIKNNGNVFVYKDPAIETDDTNKLQVKGGLSTDTLFMEGLKAATGETWSLTINDTGVVSSVLGGSGGSGFGTGTIF